MGWGRGLDTNTIGFFREPFIGGARIPRLLPAHFNVWSTLALLLLLPILCRGVVGGDEGSVLNLVREYDRLHESFSVFVKDPAHAYSSHHLAWFWFEYGLNKLTSAVLNNLMLANFVLSIAALAAALFAIRQIFLLLCESMQSVPQSLALTLAFFAGGFSIFLWVGGGTIECYMVAFVAVRLWGEAHFGEKSRCRALIFACCDSALIALKVYSVPAVLCLAFYSFFRTPRTSILTYIGAVVALLIPFFYARAIFWAVPPFYAYVDYNLLHYVERLFRQYVSVAHGMIPCLPVLLVLFWCPRRFLFGLTIKLVGIFGVTAILAVIMFDGGFNGGRYVLPFLVALLPEIAASTQAILRMKPSIALFVPVLVVCFIPFGEYRPDMLPGRFIVPPQYCYLDSSPIVTSWRVAALAGQPGSVVEYCFEHQIRNIPMETAYPVLGVSRIAFMLSGGEGPPGYKNQVEHLRHWLGEFGLADPMIWYLLRYLLAGAFIIFSCFAAVWCWRDSMRRQSSFVPLKP